MADINAWWQANAAQGRPSVLLCYAFGKAQRILHGVDRRIGPIVVHGAVEPLNAVYRAAGVDLPPTLRVTDPGVDAQRLKTALVLAPPSAQGTPWMRRFPGHADADRKSTRLNSSHSQISYAVFCLKKKKKRLHYHAICIGLNHLR